jgi:hypothetical protein
MNFAAAIADPGAPVLVALESARAALAAFPTDVGDIHSLSDSDLISAHRVLAECRNLLGARGAQLAGEVARRSTPQLGSQGPAQRTGFRTVEQFVKVATRATGREAVTVVGIGRLLNDADTDGELDPSTGELRVSAEPWLEAVARRVAAGRLSLASAEAIRTGLGQPTPIDPTAEESRSGVTARQLALAAEALCVAAETLDPDGLFKRARTLRDELDVENVGLRERERRERRSLRVFATPDGMGKLIWTMDPETLASVKEIYDRATSPKLGGVRFVSGDAKQQSERILADTRTPQQLGSDAFEQLLRAGADADSSFLIGSGAPTVRITASVDALESHRGRGFIDGQSDATSIETVERLLCDSRVIGMVFDQQGQPIDLTREQRLYSRRQREALAVRDGGCMFRDCERPPSWCEAHHILQWARDGGKTEIQNGILLCKYHHLLVHNNHWEIERDPAGRYWLIPPLDVDRTRTPILMPTKSAAMRELRGELKVRERPPEGSPQVQIAG